MAREGLSKASRRLSRWILSRRNSFSSTNCRLRIFSTSLAGSRGRDGDRLKGCMSGCLALAWAAGSVTLLGWHPSPAAGGFKLSPMSGTSARTELGGYRGGLPAGEWFGCRQLQSELRLQVVCGCIVALVRGRSCIGDRWRCLHEL